MAGTRASRGSAVLYAIRLGALAAQFCVAVLFWINAAMLTGGSLLIRPARRNEKSNG